MMEKIEWYQEVLELEPSSKVFFPLAKLLQSNNQPEEAIATLQQGLDRHPEFFEARLMLIDLLDSCGRKEEALQQVERLSGKLGLYPGFWQAWAGICERQGQADISLALRLTAVLLSGRGITLMDILQSGLNSVLGDNGCLARPQPASEQSDVAENPSPAPIKPEATQTLPAVNQEAEGLESSPDPIVVQIDEDVTGRAGHIEPEMEEEVTGPKVERAEPLPVDIAVDPEAPAPESELFEAEEAAVAPEFSDMELSASAEQSVAVSVETSVAEPGLVVTEEFAAVAVEEIATTENTESAVLESFDMAVAADADLTTATPFRAEVSEAAEQLSVEQPVSVEPVLPAGLAVPDPVSVESEPLPEPAPLPPTPEPAAKKARPAPLAQDKIIHALVAESPELEHDEEPFSLRTKTMAGLLVEQGDLQGALEIYEELLAAATAPESQTELKNRISDLRKKMKGVEPASTPTKTDEKEEPLQGKEKLLDALESLARRLEARAGES